ncbi:MAG TPA: 16S rRNA (cytosine(967)-C(5))-methyltransferase RsmB [Polyangia bacterium]|nr:16S rRNA (cytosine(967)-C(5))-methyltransferase RsmB [Polyangia bacterium]
MNARDVARRVLRRVDEGAYATLALAGELAKLAPADRGLATELTYGVLKQRRRIDHALAAYAPRGIDKLDARVLDALRIGAYQILFLRVPAHAAVDDAVEAIKRSRSQKLANFANGLLRALARGGEPAAAPLGVRVSAPDWLVDDAVARFGADEAERFLAALNAPAPLWLRANTLRATRDEAMRAVAAERPDATLTPSNVVPEAFRAEGVGELVLLPAFAGGLVTAQDVAAQMIARMVDPHAGERILDACAGVGGKSAHLAALAGDGARIDSADISERKLELAVDLARRLGVTSTTAIRCDLTDGDAPLAAEYDRVLLDAPCSGLGVLRRHPEAKWRRTLADVAALAALQAKLLDALAARVRPGGVLVYSVCTYTDDEGPRQLERFLAARRDYRVDLRTGAEPLRTWPHRDDADGFFAVRLVRVVK